MLADIFEEYGMLACNFTSQALFCFQAKKKIKAEASTPIPTATSTSASTSISEAEVVEDSSTATRSHD